MNGKSQLAGLTWLTGFFFAFPGFAQPASPPEPKWSVGGAVLSAPRPYVGTDAEVFPVPLVRYESRRWSLRGITAAYRPVVGERVTFDFHAQPRFDGFDTDDSPFLRGMDEPDSTLEVGVGLDVDLGPVDLALSFDLDALGRSDGNEARAALSRTFVRKRGRVILRPEIGAFRQNGNLVDYYYGVHPDEARRGRPAYRGEPGTGFDAGALVQVRVAPRWSVGGFARWTRLPDEVRDSPIVEDGSTLFGLLGVTFDL